MFEQHVCQLCSTSTDLRFGLVRWKDPLPGASFDSIWRCRDVMACRARVEGTGEQWPVDDRTPVTAQALVEDGPAAGGSDPWA